MWNYWRWVLTWAHNSICVAPYINEWLAWFSRHVWVCKLYSLGMEKLPHWMAMPIPRQGWYKEFDHGGNCNAKFMDLACIHRTSKIEQWHQCRQPLCTHC
jgi:hypothetical protein